MPGGHELVHLAIKECQQERADVASVDVCVGHDHNLAVSPFVEVGLVANPCTDGRDHAPHLFVGKHFIFATLVRIDDLASQRQDRLVFPVPTSFGGAAGRIAFHEIEFAILHDIARAVAQLAGEAAAGESAFALSQKRLCFLGRRTCLGSQHALLRDRLGAFGVLLQILREKVAHRRIDNAFHFTVPELCFRLAFKLRMGHPHADHHRETFSHVFASGHDVFVETRLLAVRVEAPREGRTKSRNVRAAFGG